MYKISLPNFEGPFDLLLYFIKRDEINIYDIPIAKITTEFLNYIRLMQYFDLELAGEFIYMASTLIYIKTQMLLPKGDTGAAEEIEDPRTQLVERLIEYKQFKEAAYDLNELSESSKYILYRAYFEPDLKNMPIGSEYKNANLFDLINAFKKAIDRSKKKEFQHVIEIFPYTIEEVSEQLIKSISRKHSVGFFSFIEGKSKQFIVVAFLSILELIKFQKIFISQSDNFEDIIIGFIPELN